MPEITGVMMAHGYVGTGPICQLCFLGPNNHKGLSDSARIEQLEAEVVKKEQEILALRQELARLQGKGEGE